MTPNNILSGRRRLKTDEVGDLLNGCPQQADEDAVTPNGRATASIDPTIHWTHSPRPRITTVAKTDVIETPVT
jgi:hypothetical protein